MKTSLKTLDRGTKVMANGYPGTIVRHYSGNMYEIRVPGGVVCTDCFDLIVQPTEAQAQAPKCTHCAHPAETGEKLCRAHLWLSKPQS